MSSEWKTIRAAEFIEFNPRLSIKRGEVATKVAMDKLQPFTKKISATEQAEFAGGSKFCNGDTIMARITPCLENGKTAFVDILADGEVAFGSTEFIVMRAREGISDPQFIYYLVTSPAFRKVAIESMMGSSGRQRVQQCVLDELKLTVPPLLEQQKIGALLAALDQKIAHNNKINDNLQQQVQLLYSQLISGLPDDCKVPLVSQGVCQTLPTKVAKYDGEKIYIATADVSVHAITNKATRLKYNSRPSRANMQPVPWSLWFAKMKESPKFVFINDKCSELVDNCIFSTGFYGLNADRDMFYYLWAFISSPEFDRTKDAYCSGTTMQALNNDGLNKIMVYLPSKEALHDFTAVAEPIFNAIHANVVENEQLAILRDTLLPKLMSGELDVSDINI